MGQAVVKPLVQLLDAEDSQTRWEAAKALGELGVDSELVVIPGPHNQPWLREIGTLEMLLWHDRHLG